MTNFSNREQMGHCQGVVTGEDETIGVVQASVLWQWNSSVPCLCYWLHKSIHLINFIELDSKANKINQDM